MDARDNLIERIAEAVGVPHHFEGTTHYGVVADNCTCGWSGESWREHHDHAIAEAALSVVETATSTCEMCDGTGERRDADGNRWDTRPCESCGEQPGPLLIDLINHPETLRMPGRFPRRQEGQDVER